MNKIANIKLTLLVLSILFGLALSGNQAQAEKIETFAVSGI